MTEAGWQACDDPAAAIAHLQRTRHRRKRRLFGVACCRMCWPLLTDERSRRAVEVAEAFADLPLPERTRAEAEGLARRASAGAASGDGRRAAEAAALLLERDVDVLTVSRLTTAAGSEPTSRGRSDEQRRRHAGTVVDLLGNPFRPVAFALEWRTDTALSLASQLYVAGDFSAMPILADALQDAGCDNDDVLNHCRGDGPHVRGCWVVDLVLGKE